MQSDRLKNLREKIGYTQSDLADLVKVGLRQIQRYEKGETDPPANTLEMIARVLETSSDFLLGLSDNPTPYALQESELTEKERLVIGAWRRGEIVEAIKVIVSE